MFVGFQLGYTDMDIFFSNNVFSSSPIGFSIVQLKLKVGSSRPYNALQRKKSLAKSFSLYSPHSHSSPLDQTQKIQRRTVL